ncbi:MAG: succinate dehydrogenase assembly factor 2 [Steroidobacteraceae bacterium]
MTQAVPETARLSRLRWHCRRGMRELDVLLTRYFEQDYPRASTRQQQAFEALLDMQDPVILSYLIGAQIPDRQDIADVIQQLTRSGA